MRHMNESRNCLNFSSLIFLCILSIADDDSTSEKETIILFVRQFEDDAIIFSFVIYINHKRAINFVGDDIEFSIAVYI